MGPEMPKYEANPTDGFNQGLRERDGVEGDLAANDAAADYQFATEGTLPIKKKLKETAKIGKEDDPNTWGLEEAA